MKLSDVHDGFAPIATGMARFAPAIFLVWLMIASAYMPELAGCQLRRILGTSMLAKHVVGLVMVYFSVVIISPGIAAPDGDVKNIIYAICIYAWFVLTSRCNAYVILLVIFITFQSYLLHKQTQSNENSMSPEDKKRSRTLIAQLSLLSLSVTLIGTYMYMLEKMNELGADFSYWYFFVGRLHCDSLKRGSRELLEPE